MRRSLWLTAACIACGPSEPEFAGAYADAWCATFEDVCQGSVLPDHCRPDTLPNQIDPEDPLSGCVYDTFAAARCLDRGAWACSDDGTNTVIPPAACAAVWTCED